MLSDDGWWLSVPLAEKSITVFFENEDVILQFCCLFFSSRLIPFKNRAFYAILSLIIIACKMHFMQTFESLMHVNLHLVSKLNSFFRLLTNTHTFPCTSTLCVRKNQFSSMFITAITAILLKSIRMDFATFCLFVCFFLFPLIFKLIDLSARTNGWNSEEFLFSNLYHLNENLFAQAER